jgi:enoyl-CoA hydratase/carnithine racemase
MECKNLLVEVGGDFVGSITLNRPDHLNTFSTELASELDQALGKLDGERKVRVVILKGAGKAFCAGIDVAGFFGKTTPEYREWIERMGTPMVTISRMAKPVIAQVQGVAAAIGAGLVAAADLAIMADNARLGLTAINVGLNCIGPAVPVARSIGRKRALELLLYGDLINAARALEMGLVNRVVPLAELETEGREWAAMLARKSPLALQTAKKAFYAAADMDYCRAFPYMAEILAGLCATEDAQEGVKAFLEKREPQWSEGADKSLSEQP